MKQEIIILVLEVRIVFTTKSQNRTKSGSLHTVLHFEGELTAQEDSEQQVICFFAMLERAINSLCDELTLRDQHELVHFY